MECLSHSTLCGEDWLSLCDVSWEAAPPPPFRQAYVPAPVCCSWSRKEQASFFFPLRTNELMAAVWNVGWNGPSRRRMHILAFAILIFHSKTASEEAGLMFLKFAIVTTICWAQKKNKSIKASEMLTLSLSTWAGCYCSGAGEKKGSALRGGGSILTLHRIFETTKLKGNLINTGPLGPRIWFSEAGGWRRWVSLVLMGKIIDTQILSHPIG